jgi:hypothetical protein
VLHQSVNVSSPYMPRLGPLTSRLKTLPNLSKAELRSQWQQLFGRRAPEILRKDLMVQVLAYRIQELTFGGMKPAIRKRLEQIAKTLAMNPGAKVSESPAIKPGTRLIREWRGKAHVVTVVDNGLEYGGTLYASLSEIARVITGTRWSGPLFFGLKAKGKEKND